MQFECHCGQTAQQYEQLLEGDDACRHLKNSIDNARQYSASDCSNAACLHHYARLISAVVSQYKGIIYLSPDSEMKARIGTFERLLTFDERTRRQLLDSDFEAIKQTIDQLLKKAQEDQSANASTMDFLSWIYREVEGLRPRD
jgi:hypothetical protein